MSEPLTLATRLTTPFRRFWRWLSGADRPLTVYQLFRDFFGDDLARLETHQKSFPGYDLASINRALASVRQECSVRSQEVGAVSAFSIEVLLVNLNTFYGRAERPQPFRLQRVAVDVDEEESVVSGGLYFLELRPEAGRSRPRKSAALHSNADGSQAEQEPEKLAVLLIASAAGDYWDDMQTNQAPAVQLTIGVACRRRDAADRFFAEMDDRRRRQSVYRGKVIEPVLAGNMIHSIAFRTVKRVQEQDLILPDEVKTLLRAAVVGFYRHSSLLEELGIEMKRGLLLHGPPGTGKTSVSLYLAGLLNGFTICFVSGDRLLHPREVCRMARYLQPTMVVFEDIDLVAADRDANGLATVLGELMNQIDGCEPTEQVLFVMNTNSLDRLEAAVKNRPGRVDQILEVPLPDRPARRQLLRLFARRVELPAGELTEVLEAMRGMSPAMIKEVVKRAVVLCLERQEGREVAEEDTKSSKVALSEDDLLRAARQVQMLRDPTPAPGALGFRRSDEEDG